MAYTEQQSALQTVRTIFGRDAWTEDHEHYRRVGFTRGRENFSAIGDTWTEAIEELKARAAK